MREEHPVRQLNANTESLLRMWQSQQHVQSFIYRIFQYPRTSTYTNRKKIA